MQNLPSLVPAEIELTEAQLAMVDDFQKIQQLPTRMAALQFLLDIALEAGTASGRRLRDKPIMRREG